MPSATLSNRSSTPSFCCCSCWASKDIVLFVWVYIVGFV